jgi:hypothetical protein
MAQHLSIEALLQQRSESEDRMTVVDDLKGFSQRTSLTPTDRGLIERVINDLEYVESFLGGTLDTTKAYLTNKYLDEDTWRRRAETWNIQNSWFDFVEIVEMCAKASGSESLFRSVVKAYIERVENKRLHPFNEWKQRTLNAARTAHNTSNEGSFKRYMGILGGLDQNPLNRIW